MRRLVPSIGALLLLVGVLGPAVQAGQPDKFNPSPLVAICEANGGEASFEGPAGIYSERLLCLHSDPVLVEDYKPKHLFTIAVTGQITKVDEALFFKASGGDQFQYGGNYGEISHWWALWE